MTVSFLASQFALLEKTASRNDMTVLLADLFREATPTEAQMIAYMSLGRLVPKFEPLEFNLATKTMLKIIAQAYEIEEKDVRATYKENGDVGLAVEIIGKSHISNSELSVTDLYNQLVAIAQEEGSGSVERKTALFVTLFQQLDPRSAKYVARIPVGTLRLGFSDMTILDALSWMNAGDKSLRKQLERAYNVSTDIGLIARQFCEAGVDGIANMHLSPGIPVRPQQAERMASPEAIIEKLGPVVVEYKLDGFRAQIHVFKATHNPQPKKVSIFSRSMERWTEMFPEIAEAVQALDVDSVILDGEAIGYDPKTGAHLPFQETIQRKRKHGIDEIAQKIPLRYYAFDILQLNGTDLLTEPFSRRREILTAVFQDNTRTINPNTIALSEQILVSTPDDIASFFQESVAHGYEGIMIKKPDAPYQAGSRNFTWIKYKHSGKGKLVDTVDAVVLGYYAGRGKRSAFGIGAFLVGIRQPTTHNLMTIAKIGTGLSDEQWKELREKCEKYAVKNKPEYYSVPKELTPDQWVDPHIVVEVAADEITQSPLHTAGLALRFPRLLSFRTDKSPEQATDAQELHHLYSLQTTTK